MVILQEKRFKYFLGAKQTLYSECFVDSDKSTLYGSNYISST